MSMDSWASDLKKKTKIYLAKKKVERAKKANKKAYRAIDKAEARESGENAKTKSVKKGMLVGNALQANELPLSDVEKRRRRRN